MVVQDLEEPFFVRSTVWMILGWHHQQGGGISVVGGKSLDIAGSKFTRNSAVSGGAISAIMTTGEKANISLKSLLCTSSTFQNNTATTYGGTVRVAGNTSIGFISSVFTGCRTKGDGACIHAVGSPSSALALLVSRKYTYCHLMMLSFFATQDKVIAALKFLIELVNMPPYTIYTGNFMWVFIGRGERGHNLLSTFVNYFLEMHFQFLALLDCRQIEPSWKFPRQP